MTTVAITETMEQVHKHLEKYLALHREILDERDVIARAVEERWPGADPRAVLEQAEVNSLTLARARMLTNPKKNPWVTTTAQGDLFNTVLVRVPSVLMIDGKPKPYFEASILDGLEWWRARHDAKAVEANSFAEAAQIRRGEMIEAAAEAEKLEGLVRTAMASGIDPLTVRYAKTKTADAD